MLGQNYLRKFGLLIIWAVGIKCQKLWGQLTKKESKVSETIELSIK
jgi:hypothetical protein